MPEENSQDREIASKENEVGKPEAIHKIDKADQVAKVETRAGRKMLSVHQQLFPEGRVYVN